MCFAWPRLPGQQTLESSCFSAHGTSSHITDCTHTLLLRTSSEHQCPLLINLSTTTWQKARELADQGSNSLMMRVDSPAPSQPGKENASIRSLLLPEFPGGWNPICPNSEKLLNSSTPHPHAFIYFSAFSSSLSHVCALMQA